MILRFPVKKSTDLPIPPATNIPEILPKNNNISNNFNNVKPILISSFNVLETKKHWQNRCLTCKFFHKIAFNNNFFPSFTNQLSLANVLAVEKFEYFLYHFWWQMVNPYTLFYTLCICHFESFPTRNIDQLIGQQTRCESFKGVSQTEEIEFNRCFDVNLNAIR